MQCCFLCIYHPAGPREKVQSLWTQREMCCNPGSALLVFLHLIPRPIFSSFLPFSCLRRLTPMDCSSRHHHLLAFVGFRQRESLTSCGKAGRERYLFLFLLPSFSLLLGSYPSALPTQVTPVLCICPQQAPRTSVFSPCSL